MQESSDTNTRSRQIKSGIVLALLFLVLIFALQNSESASVVFLFWELILPRAVIFFVFFLVGFLAGLAVCNWKILKGDSIGH
jgi:uncharacterized integral membrane protein